MSVPPTVHAHDGNALYLASMADPDACEIPDEFPWLLVLSCSGGGLALLLLLALVVVCRQRKACCFSARAADEPSAARPPPRRDGDRKVGNQSGKKPATWVTDQYGNCVKSDEDLRAELLAESRQDYGLGAAGGSAGGAYSSAPAATAADHDAKASAYGAYSPAAVADASGHGSGAGPSANGAYTPLTADGRPEECDAADVAKGLSAASAVEGLEALMSAAGLPERLPAAGSWCEEQGWQSVEHLRSGGARTADAFVAAMRLKADGPRGRRLKKELKKDAFEWDAHASAARATS